MEQPEEQTKNVLLVLTSNRGLCGGYNGAVLRHVTSRLKQAKKSGEELAIEVAGKRGLVLPEVSGTRLRPRRIRISKTNHVTTKSKQIADRYIEGFIAGDIDRVDVAYTKFESASRQTAVLETLLPVGSLGDDDATDEGADQGVDYEFLPSPQEDILEEIVPAAFKARLFKCFLDAAVSEQIARMVAMKGATENAGDMISELSHAVQPRSTVADYFRT